MIHAVIELGDQRVHEVMVPRIAMVTLADTATFEAPQSTWPHTDDFPRPSVVVAFRRAYPEIAIRLAVGNTTDAADAVRAGQAELGFVEGALDDPTLASTTIAQDQLVLVVAPGHAFAEATDLEPENLAGVDWVLREAGSGTRSAFEAALGAAGLAAARLRVTLELPSNEAVRAAVEAGGGAAVLSETVVAASLRAGTLVRAAFDLPSRPFRVLRHKERYRSRAADALLHLIAAANAG